MSTLYLWTITFVFFAGAQSPWCTRGYSEPCRMGDYMTQTLQLLPLALLAIVIIAMFPWITMLFVRSLISIISDLKKRASNTQAQDTSRTS